MSFSSLFSMRIVANCVIDPIGFASPLREASVPTIIVELPHHPLRLPVRQDAGSGFNFLFHFYSIKIKLKLMQK